MVEESKSKKPRIENDSNFLVSDISSDLYINANFPNEVWLQIFEYLSTYEILRKIALVNKRFNILSKNSSLVKKIHLNIDKLDNNSAKDAYETIQRSRNLMEMIICSDLYQYKVMVL